MFVCVCIHILILITAFGSDSRVAASSAQQAKGSSTLPEKLSAAHNDNNGLAGAGPS